MDLSEREILALQYSLLEKLQNLTTNEETSHSFPNIDTALSQAFKNERRTESPSARITLSAKRLIDNSKYSYGDAIEYFAFALLNKSTELVIEDNQIPTKTYFRNNLSGKVRQDVLMRDNYTCQICGATVDDGVKLEIDHIIPVSKGGTNDENNLQVLCQQCNREKHNRDDLLHDKRKLAEWEGN
jgi:5-methylcytosine-specific restriction endonuclease McrA